MAIKESQDLPGRQFTSPDSQISPEAIPPSPHIEIRNLSVRTGNAVLLNDISLDIPRGEKTVIMGPSGCGKSTFARAINRMHDITPNMQVSGVITLDGQNIYDPRMDPVALRQRVGMIFQFPNPFPKSIFENVAYGLKIQGYRRGELQDRVEIALKQAELWEEVKDRLGKDATKLSGGQQQRLCIARALAAIHPEALLMDEPTSALDPPATERIEKLITDLCNNGTTIILVTHNLSQVGRLNPALIALFWNKGNGGELIESGTPDEMFVQDPKEELTRQFINGEVG